MRDLLITLTVFGGLPFIFIEPIVGLLMWAWLSYMTPYRLAWGFSRNFPFVMITAVVTLAALFISKREKSFPWTPTTCVWIAFLAWMTLGLLFAIYPYNAFVKWEEVMKIQLMVLVTFLLVHERKHLDWVIWIAVISIGFYGVKGGIFTILTGGNYHVWGPPGSWIADNNELGAAVLLVMPLMRYLQLHNDRRWVWWGLGLAMILSAFAVLGTYSRGDFLGALVMIAVFWWRSRRKVLLTVPLVAIAIVAVAFMPTQWVARMHSISNYQHNASALGRINAWHFATNLALHHPLFGGGFEAFTAQMFKIYAPDPNNFHAAHSIFFQILGDNGFVGLGLYLLLGVFTFRTGFWISHHVKGREDLFWARDLGAMLQVGFAGFAASAAFLSLAYYDLPYQLMACMVILQQIVQRTLYEHEGERTAFSQVTATSGRRAAAGQIVGVLGESRPAWYPGLSRSFKKPQTKAKDSGEPLKQQGAHRSVPSDQRPKSAWQIGRDHRGGRS